MRHRSVVVTQILFDALLTSLIWAGSMVIQSVWGSGPLTNVATASIVAITVLWIGLRALWGLYPGYGLDPVTELRRQSYALATTLAIITTFAVALQIGDLFSRLLLVGTFLGLGLLAPPARHLVKRWTRRTGDWGKPVAVLRAGEETARVVRTLQAEWGLGLKPVAIFDDRRDLDGPLEDVPHCGAIANAGEWAREFGVDTAIVAAPRGHDEQLSDLVNQASSCFRHVIVVPNLGGITTSAVLTRDLAGIFGFEIKYNLLNPWARRTKRAVDLLGAGVGGLIISPLLLATVLLIKLDSPGPAIYGQQRLGSGDRHFCCLKFRTMRLDAERVLNEHLQKNPDLQAEWETNHKLRKDPRVTRVGRFLRVTSLDELPQLWNVIRGEMSLVGPRPIVDVEVPKYGDIYELYRRVTPGISGFWQVSGRSDTTYEERVAMDAYYVRNWSVWLDLVILARTITSVLSGRGAH